MQSISNHTSKTNEFSHRLSWMKVRGCLSKQACEGDSLVDETGHAEKTKCPCIQRAGWRKHKSSHRKTNAHVEKLASQHHKPFGTKHWPCDGRLAQPPNPEPLPQYKHPVDSSACSPQTHSLACRTRDPRPLRIFLIHRLDSSTLDSPPEADRTTLDCGRSDPRMQQGFVSGVWKRSRAMRWVAGWRGRGWAETIVVFSSWCESCSLCYEWC